MKYKLKQEQEFPALSKSKRNVEDDGFGHMVEDEIIDAEDAELDKAEVSSAKENSPETPVLKVDPAEFEYDQNSDTV